MKRALDAQLRYAMKHAAVDGRFTITHENFWEFDPEDWDGYPLVSIGNGSYVLNRSDLDWLEPKQRRPSFARMARLARKLGIDVEVARDGVMTLKASQQGSKPEAAPNPWDEVL